jgi:hypothetical protein
MFRKFFKGRQGEHYSRILTPSQSTEKYEEDEALYVLLPYFNYCGYAKRRQLFIEFVERLSDSKIRIVVIEAKETGKDYDLPNNLKNVYLHIRLTTSDQIWIKENLVNIGIHRLPSTWKYMAWVDADITFLNRNWVTDTIEQLKQHDVVQLYHTCVNLGPDDQAMKIDTSFFYMYKQSGKDYHPAAKYGFWHPGYAWGLSKKAYTQIGGLIDFGILGSGDRHMALAFIGLVKYSHPGNIHPAYIRKLLEFEKRCHGLSVNFVPGTILHHWHGKLANRKYVERWQILTKNKYDPDNDIEYTKNGILQLTENGKRLTKELKQYFEGRQEDDSVV